MGLAVVNPEEKPAAESPNELWLRAQALQNKVEAVLADIRLEYSLPAGSVKESFLRSVLWKHFSRG
jgi:hypothetical protein